MVADGRNRNAIETRKGKSHTRRNDTLKERNDVGVTLLTSLCESLGTFFLRQHIEGHEVSHHFQVALKTRDVEGRPVAVSVLTSLSSCR